MNNFWGLAHNAAAPCIIDGETGELATYGKVTTEVEAIGAGFSQEGKSFGFILSRNTLPSLCGYLAALRGGHAACLCDASLDPLFIASLIAAYRPDWIWQPVELPMSPGYRQSETACHGFTLLIRSQREPSRQLHPDLALLLATSGSTGSPRMVRLSLANLDANARSIAASLELTPGERPITSLPMHYSYGLSVINSHLTVGAAIVLTSKTILSREFWNLICSQQVTSLSGVPYTYQMLHRLNFAKMELPSLTSLTQAGGRLDLNLHRYFAETAAGKNIRFFVMYGQTEATARISCLPWQRALEGIGSIGVPIEGGSLEIDAESSELIYTGPNVMMGYADCLEDLAKGDELGGRLPTGDIGRRDENGLYYITGRLKRFIKLFGLRINLDDLEKVIEAGCGVNCPCVGDDTRLLVSVPDSSLSEQVHEILTTQIHLHHSAFRVVVDDAVPRLASGKTDYKTIMARHSS